MHRQNDSDTTLQNLAESSNFANSHIASTTTPSRNSKDRKLRQSSLSESDTLNSSQNPSEATRAHGESLSSSPSPTTSSKSPEPICQRNETELPPKLISIGIELEFVVKFTREALGPDSVFERVCEAIQVAGDHDHKDFPQVEVGEHDPKHKWVVKAEGGLIKNDNDDNDNEHNRIGMEVTSPVYYDYGPASAWPGHPAIVARALRTLPHKDLEAYTVNEEETKTGYHVHASTGISSTLTNDELRKLAIAVVIFESAYFYSHLKHQTQPFSDEIDAPHLPHCWNTEYAKTFKLNPILHSRHASNSHMYTETWYKFQSAKNREDIKDLMTNGDYNWKVSFEMERGTVEFRQAEFMLDEENRIGWADVVTALIRVACQLDKDNSDDLCLLNARYIIVWTESK
jgi:hypothetical protein